MMLTAHPRAPGCGWEQLTRLSALANLALHENPLMDAPRIQHKLLCAFPSVRKLNFAPVSVPLSHRCCGLC